MLLRVLKLAYFGDRFGDHCFSEKRKIRANNMHQSQYGRTLAKVNYDVGIFEYEKRLKEYEKYAKGFGHKRYHKCELAFIGCFIVVYINVNHLNHFQGARKQGTYAKYGRTYSPFIIRNEFNCFYSQAQNSNNDKGLG